MLNTTQSLQMAVMGRPVAIQADDRDLLTAVSLAYDEWLEAAADDGPPIRLSLTATDSAWRPGPVRPTVAGARLDLTGGGIEGWADARSLIASCRIPRDLLARPELLAAEVLDTLLLFLLARSGRTPIHAAGIIVGDAAMVLAGRSGSGKSSLSLAAMARGLRILSDDTVYIQLLPGLRIWGFPRPLHLFPADAPGFTAGTRLRAGKLKPVVPVKKWAGSPVADRGSVVLLERGSSVQLRRVEASEIADGLAHLEPGFDLLAEQSAAAADALAAGRGWRLTLGSDPGEAIDLLLQRLGPG